MRSLLLSSVVSVLSINYCNDQQNGRDERRENVLTSNGSGAAPGSSD